jgi:OOP family OmpA-OmpF porin
VFPSLYAAHVGSVNFSAQGQSFLRQADPMKLALGFNVNPNFAIEGGYFDSGTLTYTGTATGATIAADSKATGFQFALVGNAPLSDTFSIFAKAGYTAVSVKSYARINSTSASGTSDKNNGGFGFGAKYKISEKLWLRGEWEQVASDVSAITFGVESRF